MLESVIDAWHEAVNNRDLAAAKAAVTDPVDVSGPHGTQLISAEAFTEWILRSGIRLRPLTSHPIDVTTVVIEQEATWPETPGPARVATLFRISNGLVSTVHRFDSLTAAINAATTQADR